MCWQLLRFHLPLTSGCVMAIRQRERGERACLAPFDVARPRARQTGGEIGAGSGAPIGDPPPGFSRVRSVWPSRVAHFTASQLTRRMSQPLTTSPNPLAKSNERCQSLSFRCPRRNHPSLMFRRTKRAERTAVMSLRATSGPARFFTELLAASHSPEEPVT